MNPYYIELRHIKSREPAGVIARNTMNRPGIRGLDAPPILWDDGDAAILGWAKWIADDPFKAWEWLDKVYPVFVEAKAPYAGVMRQALALRVVVLDPNTRFHLSPFIPEADGVMTKNEMLGFIAEQGEPEDWFTFSQDHRLYTGPVTCVYVHDPTSEKPDEDNILSSRA